MPSTRALELARHAKHTLGHSLFDGLQPVPVSQWFLSHQNFETKVISYRDIAFHADEEYDKWRKVDDSIEHHNPIPAKLKEWLENISEEDLATLIDETPACVAGDERHPMTEFTGWQRISMIHWVRPPFDATVSYYIGTNTIRDLASYGDDETHRRKEPIGAQRSMIKGGMPEHGIIDLPTATGKTAWSMAVAYLAVSSKQFPTIREQYRNSRLGTVFQGLPYLPVARLVIVATAASTFDHFVTTLNRLIPTFQSMDPSVTFIVWTTMSKYYSTKIVAELPNDHIVFWVVPVSKLNSVLKQKPDYAVAVCITDEYTVDTPKERFHVSHSSVIKHLITQATPQALQNATRGNRSWLKDVFGGYLYSPSHIAGLVRRRSFKEAQQACEQACRFELMTITPYRDYIRADLASLVPSGLKIHFVKSRRVTMASFLLNSQVDLVPANLKNILLKSVQQIWPTPASIASLSQVMDSGSFAPAVLIEVLQNIESKYPDTDTTVILRLVERIKEFAVSCPICLCDEPQGMHLFGCCGYCVCSDCFTPCNNRCAFCRTPVPTVLFRSDVQPDVQSEVDTEVDTVNLSEYPQCPTLDLVNDFTSNLNSVVAPNKKQVTNLALSLHTLVKHGHKRFLILVEKNSYNYGDFNNYLNLQDLASSTGINLVRVDMLLRGKGKEFAMVKRSFDTESNDTPMGLVSYGMDPALLVGTNFDFVDTIITLGNIHSNILTQAINRVFRPRATRDNSKPMIMVKIFS